MVAEVGEEGEGAMVVGVGAEGEGAVGRCAIGS